MCHTPWLPNVNTYGHILCLPSVYAYTTDTHIGKVIRWRAIEEDTYLCQPLACTDMHVRTHARTHTQTVFHCPSNHFVALCQSLFIHLQVQLGALSFRWAGSPSGFVTTLNKSFPPPWSSCRSDDLGQHPAFLGQRSTGSHWTHFICEMRK